MKNMLITLLLASTFTNVALAQDAVTETSTETKLLSLINKSSQLKKLKHTSCGYITEIKNSEAYQGSTISDKSDHHFQMVVLQCRYQELGGDDAISEIGLAIVHNESTVVSFSTVALPQAD